ncbi:hypothetical protein N0V86_001247 [Didymella sp. IMI 355093]|nr:hypothetical protein N0V86_001247 [Didymella sp. IMI 355093]
MLPQPPSPNFRDAGTNTTPSSTKADSERQISDREALTRYMYAQMITEQDRLKANLAKVALAVDGWGKALNPQSFTKELKLVSKIIRQTGQLPHMGRLIAQMQSDDGRGKEEVEWLRKHQANVIEEAIRTNGGTDNLRDIDLPVVNKRYYENMRIDRHADYVSNSVTRQVNQKGLSYNKRTDNRLRLKEGQTDDETTDTELEKDKSRRRKAETMEKDEKKRSRTGNFPSTEGPQLPKASDTTPSAQMQTADEPFLFFTPTPLPQMLDAEQVLKFRGSGFHYKTFFPRSKPKDVREEDRVVGATSMPVAQPGSSATVEEPKK